MSHIEMLDEAIWVAAALFNRNKLAGSSGNLSIRCGDVVYISGSGTCFGRLEHSSFAAVDLDGNVQNDVKPSKEMPLHLDLYRKDPSLSAVIHTHSFYSTLWSCLGGLNPEDCIPEFTPYLKMKLGKIPLVPYAKPGSEKLFSAFREIVGEADGYLLQNHGPIVAGKTVMDAFYGLEELEESAHIAYCLKNKDVKNI